MSLHVTQGDLARVDGLLLHPVQAQHNPHGEGEHLQLLRVLGQHDRECEHNEVINDDRLNHRKYSF